MHFFIFIKTNKYLKEQKLIKKTYKTANILQIIRLVEIIDKKKFQLEY